MFGLFGQSEPAQTEKNVTQVIEDYKKSTELEKRKAYIKRLEREKLNNPEQKNAIPVIALSFDSKLAMSKQKFLFYEDSPFFRVTSYINNRLKTDKLIVDESQAVVCFVNGKVLPNSDVPLKQLLKDHADPEDGNLYVVYCPQVAFG